MQGDCTRILPGCEDPSGVSGEALAQNPVAESNVIDVSAEHVKAGRIAGGLQCVLPGIV